MNAIEKVTIDVHSSVINLCLLKVDVYTGRDVDSILLNQIAIF